MNPALQYPIFGADIHCPHCRQTIPALTLTDTYLCQRHGAFEANPKTGELIHLQSGRHWALDRLYTQGYRATRVIIASRYKELVSAYLEQSTPWRGHADSRTPRLYGLPIEFSPDPQKEPCWEVINFDLEKEPGVPVRYPYFRLFE
ncbi:MAG: TIGR02652 family protein [Cyanobacteria bacterium SW_6_48_11]|nr:MAG: TIGR02652 family protein [Cyanobacteria bacterium SW_6_48_11]